MFKKFVKYLISGKIKPHNLVLNTRNFQCISNSAIIRKKNSDAANDHNQLFHIDNSKNGKHFIETENVYARKILESFPIAVDRSRFKILPDRKVCTEEELNSLLNQNWRARSPDAIVRAFANVVDYCRDNNINISDTRFDELVNGFLDNVDGLTVEELYSVTESVANLPMTDSHLAHNFHDVWSALDDVCCWNYYEWDRETLLKFADLFQRLHLGRIGHYVFNCLDKLTRKPQKLTQEQLVHVFFYMNVCRKKSIEFELEDAIEAKLSTLSVDELAIIAMGFFKSQTKIKLASILNRMLELVIDNSETIHEISLAAILKIVRLSQNHHTSDNIIKALDKIVLELPRLSYLCATHAALCGTSLQLFHEPILKAVAQKCVDNISDIAVVRLKDIERLLLATTMFNYDPKTTPDFYEAAYQELHKEHRVPEKFLYPKSIPCSLTFLSIRNIYSEELMDELLKPEFTKEVYGKRSKMYPRELFSLNLGIEVDLPDYKGSRWPSEMREDACKWLIQHLWEPPPEKLSRADKLTYSLIDSLCNITSDRKYLYVGHVLPQYAKADVILCLDKSTNTFVEPPDIKNYQLHEIKRPTNLEKYKWYAFVMVSFNLTARNTFKPVGILDMKKRHLRTIGYEPILIMWNEFSRLQDEEKLDYILSRIKQL